MKRLTWNLGWLTLGIILGMSGATLAQAQGTAPYSYHGLHSSDPDRLQVIVGIGLARPARKDAEARHVIVAIGDGEGFSKLHDDYDSCVAELTAWASKAGRGGWCYQYRGDGK